MPRHRTHSIEFRRQVAQDYLAGETLHSLARGHSLSRNLIRIWMQTLEAAPATTALKGIKPSEFSWGYAPGAAASWFCETDDGLLATISG